MGSIFADQTENCFEKRNIVFIAIFEMLIHISIQHMDTVWHRWFLSYMDGREVRSEHTASS